MIELYGSTTSPYVRHCRIVLAQENIEYKLIEVDFNTYENMPATGRVPFLKDGDIVLSDSSSITLYLRQKSGKTLFHDPVTYDHFCLVNTMMDAAVNIIRCSLSGTNIEENAHLKRHGDRIKHGLDELENLDLPQSINDNDFALRLACFLDWALFREQISLDNHLKLKSFLNTANTLELFSSTSPRL